MSNETDLIELVNRAKLGDTDSLDRLAQQEQSPVRAYIYMTTLDEQLTTDSNQATGKAASLAVTVNAAAENLNVN